MDFKIPSQSFKGDPLESIQETSVSAAESASDAAGVEKLSQAATDPISLIADQVARGEISGKEAVNRILDSVLGDGIAASAPPAIRQEMEAVLQALLETHPALQSLTAAIGDQ
jgi:hypothetical protein